MTMHSSHLTPRWTPQLKRAVVLDLLAGRNTLAGLAHDTRLPIATILAWREAFCKNEGHLALHPAVS